ncbi:MAG: Imm70 family immunity protein [Rhodospirillales bacterium]
MIEFTAGIHRVATESVDDFYYARDSVHAALEDGEFGCRFPIFMLRFEGSDWKVQELVALRSELETIAAELRKLPPEPFDPHWRGRIDEPNAFQNLFEVFTDDAGNPLFGKLIELCDAAQRLGQPIAIR